MNHKRIRGALLVVGLITAVIVAAPVHATIIIDDFNACQVGTPGETCAGTQVVADNTIDGITESLTTPIDSTNIVWGVLGGAPGSDREITAELLQGDSVETEVCANCQTGHIVADAGVEPSECIYSFIWSGPSLDLSSLIEFVFSWSSDLSGTDWFVEFVDDVGDSAVSAVQNDLPGGFVDFEASVALPEFAGAVPGGQGYGDVEEITLTFLGVGGIDGNIDNVGVVPVPATVALMIVGLAGLTWSRRQRGSAVRS